MVGEQNIENRRNFYRIKLLAPMCAELTILTINAKEVTKGFSPICIEDIGVGGVRFKSKLNIPMNDTVTFGIKFSIYDTEYLLPASIVWKNELKTGYIAVSYTHLRIRIFSFKYKRNKKNKILDDFLRKLFKSFKSTRKRRNDIYRTNRI